MERKERFEIEETTLTFDRLVDQAPKEIAGDLIGKGVVILPSHGSEDAFYGGTLDTLDYLNENQIETDIYCTDEEYKELGLHGADIWLGTFFVTNFIIPVFCSVIAAYVYDKLGAKKEDKISVKFIVEKNDGSSVSVSFDGEAEKFSKALDAIKEFNNED